MKNVHERSNGVSGSETLVEEGDSGGADARPMKRVKLEESIDADSQLLLSAALGGSLPGTSLTAPPILYGKRPPGRPRKRKRGAGQCSSTFATKDQREQELLRDPRISDVQPKQVLCRMCRSWIKLCRNSDFVVTNWHTHAIKCQERTGWSGRIKEEPGRTFDLSVASVPETSNEENGDVVEVKKEEIATLRKPPRGMTSAERKLILENDSRIRTVDPHQVLCNLCERVIKLHRTRPYELWNWTQHIKKCKGQNITVQHNASVVADLAADSVSEVDAAIVVSPSVRLVQDNHAINTESTVQIHGDNPSEDIEMVVDSGEVSACGPSSASSPDEFRRLKREHLDNSTDDSRSSNDVRRRRNLSPPPAHAPSISAPLPRKEAPPPKVADLSQQDIVFAPSARHNKKGRNEEERKKALEDDPRCSEVKPHEVFCLMCKRWIKLYKEVSYIDSNWLRHAERCELKRSDLKFDNVPRINPGMANSAQPTHEASTTEVVAESSQAVATRLVELQDDRRIEKIEPGQVLCGICKQWVKLQQHRDYDTWNWRKHVSTCEDRHGGRTGVVQPSTKNGSLLGEAAHRSGDMSIEERKNILENDKRCTDVEPQRVFCLMCRRHIGLHQKKDYSIVNWFRHAEACIRKKGNPDLLQSTLVKGRVPASDVVVNESISSAPRRTRATALQDAEIVEISREEAEASVAKTETVGHAKRSVEERRKHLLSDPRVGDVEPNRIFCKLCSRWLKLNENIAYTPFNWFKHIERCESKQRAREVREEAPAPVSAPTGKDKEQSPEVVLLDGPPLTAPAGPSRGGRKRTTVEERHARLRADDRIKVLEPHRAQCGVCEKWIKLQNKIEYDPYNWYAHINKCALKPSRVSEQQQTPADSSSLPPGAGSRTDELSLRSTVISPPSSGEKTARYSIEERRNALCRDPRIAITEPHRVLCALCRQWIKLKENKAYISHNFFKHVERCERKNELRRTQVSMLPQAVPTAHDVHIKAEGDVTLNPDTLSQKDESRRAELLADPRQAAVEPGRVLCKLCNSWIKLNTSSGYLPGNWRRHASRCNKSDKWRDAPGIVHLPLDLQPVEYIDLDSENEEGPVDFGVFGFIDLGNLLDSFEPTFSSTDFATKNQTSAKEQKKPPMPIQVVRNLRARMSSASLTPKPEDPVSPHKRPHRTEAFRKEELENDPRARVVHPEKILCAMCDKWIQMRRDISYSSQNWLKHADSCQIRSGWLKKDVEVQPTPEKEDEPEEEALPYNARAAACTQIAAESEAQITALSFKPVDWEQEVTLSDGEDEDDYPISPGTFTLENVEQPTNSVTAKLIGVTIKQEHAETPSVPMAVKEKKGGAIPTPLAFLQLRRNPESYHVEQSKPAVPQAEPVLTPIAKAPPANNNLFTTTPLARPFQTTTPPLLTPLAGTSMSEFVAAIRAEKNAGLNDHSYSIGPSFAIQPTNVPNPDPPFRDVLSPVARPAIPSPVPRADAIAVPSATPPVPSDRLPHRYNQYVSLSRLTPMQTAPSNVNLTYHRERTNGTLPTPISAVLGPRPPILPPRSMIPTQVMPYTGLRQIAPAPPSGSGGVSLPTPLSAIIRDRPPMPFVSPLTPIFMPFMPSAIPIRAPSLPSPHSDTSADRQ